jgi:HPt (histidine-containing phosphotransfer) domain-containing protein
LWFRLNSKHINSLFIFNPTLDASYLEKIYHGDIDSAIEIFEMYLSEVDEIKENLIAHAEKKEKKLLDELVHKSRTSFSFVGLSYITKLMEDFERSHFDKQLTDEAEEEIRTIVKEIEKTTFIVLSDYNRMKEI